MSAAIPTVRIVALVDDLGYLRCGRCVDVTSSAMDGRYVWSDSPPHCYDRCDLCGRPCVEELPATDLTEGMNVIVAGSVWKITAEPAWLCGYIVAQLDAGYGRTGRFEFRADTTVKVAA